MTMDATGGAKLWASHRARIEHGDGLTPEFLLRAKRMGIIVVENPTHFTLRELFLKRFGPERTGQMQFRLGRRHSPGAWVRWPQQSLPQRNARFHLSRKAEG